MRLRYPDRPRRFDHATKVYIGGVIAFIGLALIVWFVVLPKRPEPRSGDLQGALWQSYLTNYVHADGRTVDPAHNGDTTSEGEGYTMLRAVWENDRPVFDKSWSWTAGHLQRPDHLFSWLWGNGGVLTAQGGQNTASDADTDIALALVMADARWHEPSDLTAARQIIPSIWQQEVLTVQGHPYLLADELEQKAGTPLLNPSYFAPYAYRLFASLDPAHPWQQLADQSLQTLQQASQLQLGSASSDHLPPDWVGLNRQTGQLVAPPDGKDTNFSFDAFRAVWRTALDYQWNHDAAAKSTLASFSTLLDDWNHGQQLYANYRHTGQPAATYSSIALYGGTLSYFQFLQPNVAGIIYGQKLADLYNPTTGRLTSTLSYYDNNWAWFGAALYHNQLPKLMPSGVHA